MPLRLVALVTVPPELVDEAVQRGRELLAGEPTVLAGEVGRCVEVRPGGAPSASYVLTALFADRAGFDDYVGGARHRAVLDWIRPHLVAEEVALVEV